MSVLTRRQLLATAAAFGASLAFPSTSPRRSRVARRERRELYPHGVASGDPHLDIVRQAGQHFPGKEGEAVQGRGPAKVADQEDAP